MNSRKSKPEANPSIKVAQRTPAGCLAWRCRRQPSSLDRMLKRPGRPSDPPTSARVGCDHRLVHPWQPEILVRLRESSGSRIPVRLGDISTHASFACPDWSASQEGVAEFLSVAFVMRNASGRRRWSKLSDGLLTVGQVDASTQTVCWFVHQLQVWLLANAITAMSDSLPATVGTRDH